MELEKIHQTKTEIIAISCSDKSDVEKTKEAFGLEYILIPGPIPTVLKDYGILEEKNGKILAKVSTFIIDKSGFIYWKYIGKNVNDRPSAETVLEHLKKMNSS